MSVFRARILPLATADIDEQAAYYARKDLAVGLRFLAAFDDTLEMLRSAPEIGSPNRLPKLANIRAWPMEGFKHVLIFYRETDEGIEVVRVLHARRNWLDLLEHEN